MRKSILLTFACAVGMTMLFQQGASAKTNQCRTMWTSCIEDRCVNQPNDSAAWQACTKRCHNRRDECERIGAENQYDKDRRGRKDGLGKPDVNGNLPDPKRDGVVWDPVRPPKPPVGAQPPVKAPLSTGTWTPPSPTPPPPASPVKDPAPKTPPARELLTKPYGGTYRP